MSGSPEFTRDGKIGKVDAKTGKITQYPYLFSENGMRDFFQDSDGRMWFGSQANNRVGYFYLAGSGTNQRAAAGICRRARSSLSGRSYLLPHRHFVAVLHSHQCNNVFSAFG